MELARRYADAAAVTDEDGIRHYLAWVPSPAWEAFCRNAARILSGHVVLRHHPDLAQLKLECLREATRWRPLSQPSAGDRPGRCTGVRPRG